MFMNTYTIENLIENCNKTINLLNLSKFWFIIWDKKFEKYCRCYLNISKTRLIIYICEYNTFNTLYKYNCLWDKLHRFYKFCDEHFSAIIPENEYEKIIKEWLSNFDKM